MSYECPSRATRYCLKLHFCCHAPPCPALQLRIGAVIRRDAAPDNPNFPGAPALPCSAVGAQALDIAKGERSDEIVRIV